MSALNGDIVTCGQHSADPIQLRVYGDEFYARYETVDGYTVVYDTDVGYFCFAMLSGGRFVSSRIPNHKPVPPGLKRHIKEAPESRNTAFGRRYANLRPRETELGSETMRTIGPDGGLLEGRKLTHGDVRGLTIIVNFDDVTTNITQGDLDTMLNGTNYNENGNFCSVQEYFDIVSSGKLNYTNTVVGPVTLSRRRSHYIGTLLVEEVMDAVVNDHGVNLADFDSRNDGIVDAINILYAGDSLYQGDLWPHNSVRVLRYGNVRTHYYLVTGLGEERVDLRIGTICHENGHLLCRFPDMYDYGQRDGDSEKSQGIGRFCLMGSGNHLNERRTPSPVCGYLRELVGWADNVVDLNSPGVFNAQHGAYDTVMKYRTDKPNEYFIIENRSQRGLDSHLPDSGLAVYHCDTLGSNEWQDGTRNEHYQCALLQADGHLDLENNRNAGDPGDLFQAQGGIVLSDTTMPHSREWDDTDSTLVVSDVGASGSVISFTVGELQSNMQVTKESSPNALIPDNDPAGVESRLNVGPVGVIASIEVEVFIIHSWISDLTVTLAAPDGATAVLHDKEGADGDDIVKTYTSAGHAALNAMEGTPISGDWVLSVVDQASQDVGRLVRWGLDIRYRKLADAVTETVEPRLAIPDNDFTGVESAIGIAATGQARDVSVEVDITHTYIGDLELDLVAPSGQTVRLHDNAGGWADDIKRSYSLADTPALQGMVGQDLTGYWTLRVRDLAGADVGTLNRWSISLAF